MKKTLLHLSVLFGLSITAISFAQPPLPHPTTLPQQTPPPQQPDINTDELPQLPKLEPRPDMAQGIQDSIREALKGDQAIGSGDPVLDDVLQIIQQRGSILRGSSLDKATDPKKPENAVVSRRYRAAESLLKAARHLEQTGPLDDAQGTLIRQMRRQSVKLMTADSNLNPAD